MAIKAKEIIDGRFWILEDRGQKLGTLSWTDDRYMISDKSGSRFVFDKKDIERDYGQSVDWSSLEIADVTDKTVYNYPANFVPYNPVLDVKRKLPIFTKSPKSKSLYCAGYYIIKFDKGWVKSFCPKLVTLDKYEYKGPFKTKIEMKTALSGLNGK